MNWARRSAAAAAAVAVTAAAVAIGLFNAILGTAADAQNMAIGGVSDTTLSVSAWVLGGAQAAFLLLCAVLLARMAVTDRPPGRLGRALLTGAAVLHAVLGALAVGLAGWPVFGVLMAVFALITLALTLYPAAGRRSAPLIPTVR